MEDKDFDTRVLEVIKSNLFSLKKLLFNMEDCVSKSDYDEVQQKLVEAQESNSKLQQHKERLENEVDNKSSEIIDLLRQKSDLITKLDNIKELRESLENKLTKERDENKRLNSMLEEKQEQIDNQQIQLDEYSKNYSELEKAYKSYQALSENVKFGLAGVFGEADSPTSFLAGALQENHLESLWDYVATAINSGSPQEELNILVELFEFAFAAVNAGRREAVYLRLEVQVDDDFDSSTMRKISSSAQSGRVKEFLLAGFKYRRTGAVIKPALVSIG